VSEVDKIVIIVSLGASELTVILGFSYHGGARRMGSTVPEKLSLEIVNGTYFTALFLLMTCIHFVQRRQVFHKRGI